MLASNVMKAICASLLLVRGLCFVPSHQQHATNTIRMSYLDSLSPAQPNDDDDENNILNPAVPSPNEQSSGVIPCGRGGLGSYLDAVTSGTLETSNVNDESEDDDILSDGQHHIKHTRKIPSWTSAYLSSFLTADDSRTDVRNLLTQRSIQSFMRLLEECRDPHSAKWIQEDFLQTGNLLDYHGTGAGFVEEFGGEEFGALLEMTRQPVTKIVVSAKRRGRGHGGWSKNNPFLEERWKTYHVDVDPANLVTRILSVREQIASEWAKDIDILVSANNQILESFFNTIKKRREGKVDSFAGSTSFDKKAAYMINENLRASVDASTPFRRANFDLMYNLCTQAAIHRILRQKKADGEDKEVSFIFLREYYIERVEECFDGDLEYGRADEFIDDLLQTAPSVISTEDGTTGLVDPVGAAESIIKMRNEVAHDWKALMKEVPESHILVRQALLSTAMDRSPSSEDNNDIASFQ
jgi:hypothetical protein